MKNLMFLITTIIATVLFATTAHAGIITKEINYSVGDKKFTGFIAYDDSVSGKRPGVLVMHEWWGHNDYARKRASMLAGLGYTAFALDMYGSGVLATHPNDAKAFMQAATSDPAEVRKRFQAAHDILKKHNTVDANKTAAIGYCMGGGMALGMARAGEDLDGIVVLHGSLGSATPAQAGKVKAKIRVFTGGADPFVPSEQITNFEKEMKSAGVDYKVKVYPDAKHSFSVPGADEKGKKFNIPLAYNKAADEDSWKRIQAFFKDIF